MGHKCVDGCECIEYLSCDVKSCSYNDKKDHCTAERVRIGGSTASTSAETLCDTFRAEA